MGKMSTFASDKAMSALQRKDSQMAKQHKYAG